MTGIAAENTNPSHAGRQAEALGEIAAGLREVAAAVRESVHADCAPLEVARVSNEAANTNYEWGQARLRERDEARAEVERLRGVLDVANLDLGAAQEELEEAYLLLDPDTEIDHRVKLVTELIRERLDAPQDAQNPAQEGAEGVAEGGGGSEGGTGAAEGSARCTAKSDPVVIRGTDEFPIWSVKTTCCLLAKHDGEHDFPNFAVETPGYRVDSETNENEGGA